MNAIKVLLVDDEKSFLEPMASWLQDKGYQVDAVTDGQEALALVQRHGGYYDIALIDQTLITGPDGVETMKRIHSEYPNLPVIILTGWGGRDSGIKAIREGAYRYISKAAVHDEIDILIQSLTELKAMQQKLEHTEREREWLRTLLDVTQAIQNQMHDLNRVFDTIGEAAQKLTKAEDWVIHLYDRLKAKLEFFPPPIPETKPVWTQELKDEFKRLRDLVLEQTLTFFIPDTSIEERINPVMNASGILSLLAVPIGKAGVLFVYGKSISQFSLQDLQVLEMLASQADVAVQNALLLKEKEQRVRELEQLRAVGAVMAEAIELPEVLQRITMGVQSLLRADSVCIWPYNITKNKFEIEKVARAGITDEEFSMIKQEPRPNGTADTIMREGFCFVSEAENPKYTFIGETSRRFFQHAGIKCFAAVALKVGNEPVGVLFLNFKEARAFGQEDETTLKTFATEATLAIKKARLYRQVQKALHHLEITADFMRLGDVDEVLSGVAQGVKNALDCDAVTLYQYDESRNTLVGHPVTIGLRDELAVQDLRELKPESTLEQILQIGEHYAEDAASDAVMRGDFIPRENVRSSAGLALRVAEQRVGILFVNYRNFHHFTEDERKLLRAFAAQAVIAIHNVQLYEKEKRRSEHLRYLYNAAQTLTSAGDHEDLLNTLLDEALGITSFSGEKPIFAHFQTYDSERDEIILTHVRPAGVLPDLNRNIGHRFSLTGGLEGRIGIIGRAIWHKQTQLVGNVQMDPDYILYHPQTRSEIAVPLIAGERVLGVFNVEHPMIDGLDEQDKRVLEMLAMQAVVVMQKAELRQTQGLLAARTSLAWMGMASSTWRHEINKFAATISDNLFLLRKNLYPRWLLWMRPVLRARSGVEVYLERIEKLIKRIQETPITAPLSAEVGVEPIQVNALLRERIMRLLDLRKLEAQDSAEMIDLRMELELPDDARVRVSREWIRRAVDILVQNALEAMKGASEKVLIVKTSDANGRAEIRLANTGKGIPNEILDKLLHEPIPKKRGERGAGMGLLLAQLIVQTYKGDIRIVASNDHGAELALSLPLESNS